MNLEKSFKAGFCCGLIVPAEHHNLDQHRDLSFPVSYLIVPNVSEDSAKSVVFRCGLSVPKTNVFLALLQCHHLSLMFCRF